jgi:hypothetical protein
MRYLPISGFPVIKAEDADPDIARQMIEIQQEMEHGKL